MWSPSTTTAWPLPRRCCRSPTRLDRTTPSVPTPTRVDELVVAKLRKLGIVPSEICTDTEFLRRLSLDMTGSLPAPREVEAFLADPSPSKREQKIDELSKRPTYAAWWATKFCDITGDNTSRSRTQAGGPADDPPVVRVALPQGR